MGYGQNWETIMIDGPAALVALKVEPGTVVTVLDRPEAELLESVSGSYCLAYSGQAPATVCRYRTVDLGEGALVELEPMYEARPLQKAVVPMFDSNGYEIVAFMDAYRLVVIE